MPPRIKKIDNEELQRRLEKLNAQRKFFDIEFENRPKPEEERELVAPKINLKRRNVGVGEVLDTVGIELESLGLTQRDVTNIIIRTDNGNYFKVHRDASSEMRVFSVPNPKRDKLMQINYHTEAASKVFKGKEVTVAGYELVSVPMDIITAQISLHSLLPVLKNSGDFTSNRCATHVHVGMAKNLRMMKNVLKLGLWADELFFAISGMGRQFRGSTNNAIYARPILNGPYFSKNNDFYQVLNWKKALEARTLNEFMACYGIDLQREISKYHPARYFSINLFSVFLHDTLEFRHFNQSFDPALVSAVAKLCQMFTEIGIVGESSLFSGLEPGNVFSTESPSYYSDKLDKLIRMASHCHCSYTLDNSDIRVLNEAIDTYKGIGIKNSCVRTHIKEVGISDEIIDLGKLVRANQKPIEPGNIDIHNITYSSIMED